MLIVMYYMIVNKDNLYLLFKDNNMYINKNIINKSKKYIKVQYINKKYIFNNLYLILNIVCSCKDLYEYFHSLFKIL